MADEAQMLPVLSVNKYGKGQGIYLADFNFTNANTRLLLNLISTASNEDHNDRYLTSNFETECAYYPENRSLIVINNSNTSQTTDIILKEETNTMTLEPYQTVILRNVE